MDRIAQEAHNRQRMMQHYQKNHNATEAARLYHVSRKTVYKWLALWDGTWQSLRDRSRAPHRRPRKQSDEDLRLVKRLAKQHKWEDMLLAYQEAKERHGYKYSYACFRKTARKLRGEKVMKRKAKRHNKQYQRAAYPGEKVQVDVKYVPSECVVDGNKYYQYTAVDECSRWTYREMYDEHSTYSSKAFLLNLLKKAPFPIREIQTDNGAEFTNFLRDKESDRRTLFEAALAENDILYHRIKPGTPQHNGKVERQHRTDQMRFYDDLRMYSLEDGRKQLAVYQKKSNDCIKLCLGLQSPNQIIAKYLAVM